MAKKQDESTAPKGEKVTQKEAVKQALAAGKELPKDGVTFVKDTFGMDLSNQAFSTLKSQIKSAGGTQAKSGAKSAPKAAHPSGNGKPASNAAELALAVKQLVAQHGATAIKDMVNVFAD